MALAPVRLLKVVPTLMCGGTEHQFMALARSLNPSRFALEFACLRRRGDFVNEIEARRIPLREYAIRGFLRVSAIAQQTRFACDIQRQRVEIVHAYSFYGNVFAIPPARLATRPVVIASIRDRGAYLTPRQQFVQRHVCRLADCILVNADAVRAWLEAQGYSPSKITVIRNGVDVRRFSPRPGTDRIRRALGVPSGAPLAMVVSRLDRLKGIDRFLEAASIVGPRVPDARFVVVGEPNPDDRSYLDELMRRSDRLGIRDRVVFTGLRTDVPELLACAAVSVMPSLNEGLSNVILESMAAGAPVVATRVGGTPEAIEDGVTGLIVPPGDPAALADAMTRLLTTPELAARLGHEGRERARRLFSLDAMVGATEALYYSLLEARRRPPPAGSDRT